MAWPFLASLRFPTAALVLLASPMVVFAQGAQTAQPATMQCTEDPAAKVPASQRETLKELQQGVESGPLYQELVSTSGKPQACKVTREDKFNEVTLTYLLNEQWRLEATINPAVEYLEQNVKLTRITEERALALLMAAVKHSFGGRCGITWSKPSERTAPGLREVFYRGNATCRCAARKVYVGGRITELSVIRTCGDDGSD